MLPRAETFEDALAEAACMLFDDDANSSFVGGDGGWNGLSDVSVRRVEESGDRALADRLVGDYPVQSGYLVWFRVDDGHARVVTLGHDEGLRSGSDRVNELFADARSGRQ